jgi:hypothetical protein
MDLQHSQDDPIHRVLLDSSTRIEIKFDGLYCDWKSIIKIEFGLPVQINPKNYQKINFSRQNIQRNKSQTILKKWNIKIDDLGNTNTKKSLTLAPEWARNVLSFFLTHSSFQSVWVLANCIWLFSVWFLVIPTLSIFVKHLQKLVQSQIHFCTLILG